MTIEQLKRFGSQNQTVDELMLAVSQLKTLASTYAGYQVEIPEWIGDKVTEIDVQIALVTAADKQARLKRLMAKRSALMTANEQREALDREISALKGESKD